MFTLWILIMGFGNSGGSVALLSGAAQMQPIATYRSAKACSSTATQLYRTLRAGGVDANVICLPTGVADPLRAPR